MGRGKNFINGSAILSKELKLNKQWLKAKIPANN